MRGRSGSTVNHVLRTLAVSGLATVMALIVGVLSARALGPTGRGHFAVITAWFGVGMVLADIGQSVSVTYHVARYPERAADVVFTSRLVGVVPLALLALGGITVTGGLGEPDVVLAYRLVLAAVAVNVVSVSVIFGAQARSIPKWNTIRMIQPVVYALFVVTLWVGHALTLPTISAALLVSVTIQAAYAFRVGHGLGLLGGSYSGGLLRSLLTFGGKQGLSAVPTAFGSQVDRILLSQLVGPTPLGLYAVAATVVGIASPVGSSIGAVLLPRLSAAHIESGERIRSERIGLLVTGGVILLAGLVSAFLATWLVPVVYGPAFSDAIALTWWLVPAVVALALAALLGDLLRARGLPGAVALVQWVGLLATTVAILLLVPMLGVGGAALAMALGQGLAVMMAVVTLSRARQRDGTAAGPPPHILQDPRTSA